MFFNLILYIRGLQLQQVNGCILLLCAELNQPTNQPIRVGYMALKGGISAVADKWLLSVTDIEVKIADLQ